MITPGALKEAFKQDLPGRLAQIQMSPLGNVSDRSIQNDAKMAAVMAIINFSSIEPTLVLIQRKSGDIRDRHAGQISFPGGKQEFNDKNLLNTALRETREEVGLPSDRIDVLGPLTPLYIPVSDFNVFPYVGMSSFDQFVLEQREVESIIHWPIKELLTLNAIQYTDLKIRKGIRLKKVPYFDCQGHILWGATAMMLNELRILLH